VGTKVAYGTLILMLVIGLVMAGKEWFKSKNKGVLTSLLILVVTLVTSVIVTPYAPITKSTNVSLQKAGFTDGEESNDHQHQVDEGKEDLNDNGVTSIVFSGRDKYLNKQKVVFEKAPWAEKLLGLSGEGTVERDFHDLFFMFGALGFIVVILPLLYYVCRLLLAIMRNMKTIFTPHFVLLGCSLTLALGVGFLAGHVFVAPAVSIYVVFVMAHLVNELKIEQ
jgi:hypothetical protein